MPEEEKKVEEVKSVPLDTTGPGVEVDLPDETVKEAEAAPETEQKEEAVKVEEVKEEPKTEEPVKTETEAKKDDSKLEEYSEGVQKRIAKLTRKMREAERREKAALDYAQGAKLEMAQVKEQFQSTEEKYDKAFSEKVTEQLKSAQTDLAVAIESGDAQNRNRIMAFILYLNTVKEGGETEHHIHQAHEEGIYPSSVETRHTTYQGTHYTGDTHRDQPHL